MVFTRLGDSDKHAFFELLDEYFATRPELFSPSYDADASSEAAKPILPSNNVQSRAASAVTRALASNPEATANLISSGLRHSANAHAASPNAHAGGAKSPQSNVMAAASDPEVANSVGRVAAAAFAFGHNQNQNQTVRPSSFKSPPPAPPSLPNRSTSSFSNRSLSPSAPSPPPPPPAPPLPPPSHAYQPTHKAPSTSSNLVSSKSIGKIDTTSFSRGVISLATKAKPPPPAAPPQQPALARKAGGFAPPPVRRVTPDASGGSPSSTPGAGAPPLPRRQIEPEPEPEEEVIWAEALYDYDSGEPGDLQLREKQRVKITERDSDDWWTGEVDGRSGLFPAAYVKLL